MYHQPSYEAIFAGVAPRVQFGHPLARYTTWRIGGAADVLIEPTEVEQIRDAVSRAREYGIPVLVIGRGSNLLVQDGGVRGLVLHLGDDFATLDISGSVLRAMAGRALVSAANIAIRHGLSGLEFATLIPGTVGGGVAMNAGAHGGEMKDVLQSVTVLTPEHEVLTLSPTDLQYAYRHSVVHERGYIVLEAEFALEPGVVQEMQERVRTWSRKRQQSQPLSLPNCGSVFRNPPGDYAARLVEAAGLKGMRMGNAAISDLHANFIVNLGQARAADVKALIAYAQKSVVEQFGIKLGTEVRVVGEDETRG